MAMRVRGILYVRHKVVILLKQALPICKIDAVKKILAGRTDRMLIVPIPVKMNVAAVLSFLPLSLNYLLRYVLTYNCLLIRKTNKISDPRGRIYPSDFIPFGSHLK